MPANPGDTLEGYGIRELSAARSRPLLGQRGLVCLACWEGGAVTGSSAPEAPPPPDGLLPGRPESGRIAIRGASSRPPGAPGARLSEVELSAAYRTERPPSLEELRRPIIQRILRAWVVLGGGGLIYEMFVGHDLPASVLGMGAAVLFCSALVTTLPHRLGILVTYYPWALLTVAISVAYLMGPTTLAFVALSGALFQAALLVDRGHLLVLAVTSLFGMALACASGSELIELEPERAGVVGALAVLSLVLPASLGGYLLVGALNQALSRWGELVEGLKQEATRRDQALGDLVQAQAQITHTQKLDLLGQLAGGVAHDMNNALTAVMGEASLLREEAREERERILQAAEHAAQLVQQLMALGRRDVMRPRPLDLGTTVRRAAQAIRRVLPSDISLQTQIADHPLTVMADPNQLLQVLLNLCQNARDAMGTSGAITIAVSPGLGGGAVLSVADTGPGIVKEVLPRIFEPFFTTKPPGEGTGLGLSNVKTIIEELSGKVSVDSVEGEGTIFDLWLPTTESPVEDGEDFHSNPTERSGTILVVEDDVRVRAVAFTALERVGYQVLEAPNPAVAEVLLRDRQMQIDLVLTDVVMEDGGGARVLDLVEQYRPETAVLVMSGYNASETLRRGVSQGDLPFLAKPFMADQLTEAVDSALRARQVSAES